MKKNKTAIKNVLRYLKTLSKSNSVFDYAIIYGLFSSLLIFLKQGISFFVLYNDSTVDNTLFGLSILGSLILHVAFQIIFFKKISEDNKFANIYVKAYPFLLFLLALLIMSIYSELSDRLISIVIMMIFISWVQIYKLKRRLLIYAFILITYISYSLLHFGFGSTFLRDNFIVLMFILISFLTSTIIYQIFKNHSIALDNLNKKNINFKNVIDRLRKTHEELKQSKIITDTMYELTQEVLKNEKLDDILQLVLDRAVDLIPNSQAGSILVLIDGKMNYVAAKGYNLENLRKIQLSPEELFQATLEDKYQPYIIKNLEVFDEVHLSKEKTQQLKEQSALVAKSCLTCSFKYKNEFFGSINIDNFESENIFTENDKYQIKQLANELEIIISVHKLYEQAIKPTKFDDLTNAFTRKHCMNKLTEMIKSKAKKTISIISIDINDLKQINDKYGHDVGDKYLECFAQSIREANIKDHIFGRIGGDEFLLIFEQTDYDDAIKEIEKIRKYFENNLFESGDCKEIIKFGAGVSVYPNDHKNIQDLIKISDRRMYIDKHEQKK